VVRNQRPESGLAARLGAPEIIVHNRAQARDVGKIVEGGSVRRNVPLSIAVVVASAPIAQASARARTVVWVAVERFALRSVRAHCAAVLAVETCVQTIARALIVRWNARVRNAARTACLMLAEIAPQVAQARAAARGNGKSTKLATHT